MDGERTRTRSRDDRDRDDERDHHRHRHRHRDEKEDGRDSRSGRSDGHRDDERRHRHSSHYRSSRGPPSDDETDRRRERSQSKDRVRESVERGRSREESVERAASSRKRKEHGREVDDDEDKGDKRARVSDRGKEERRERRRFEDRPSLDDPRDANGLHRDEKGGERKRRDREKSEERIHAVDRRFKDKVKEEQVSDREMEDHESRQKEGGDSHREEKRKHRRFSDRIKDEELDESKPYPEHDSKRPSSDPDIGRRHSSVVPTDIKSEAKMADHEHDDRDDDFREGEDINAPLHNVDDVPYEELGVLDEHQKKIEKVRGITMMNKLLQQRGSRPKLAVDFDHAGNPVGVNRNSFISYLGVLTRSHCCPNVESWHKVSKGKKDLVWKKLCSIFELDEKMHRKCVMQRCGRVLRNYRTNLTRDYIRDAEKRKKPTTEQWNYLDPNDREEFVTKRKTDEFKAINDAKKARRALNVHDHTMCPKGYTDVRQRLQAESTAQSAATQETAESSTIGPVPLPHNAMWIAERQNKKEDITKPATAETATKMWELNEQRKEDKFIPEGTRDELIVDLGSSEHPERVRGVGDDVGIKTFFGQLQRKPVPKAELSNVEIDELVNRRVEEVLNKRLNEAISKWLTSQTATQTIPVAYRSSPIVEVVESNSVDPPPSTSAGLKSCHLKSQEYIVAEAEAYPPIPGDMFHGTPMPDGAIRVSLIHVLPNWRDLPLPYAHSDSETLGEAEDGVILWPKADVVYTNIVKRKTPATSRPPPRPPKVPNWLPSDLYTLLGPNCRGIAVWIGEHDPNFPINVSIPEDAVGQLYDDNIFIQDILELFRYDWLNTSMIELWICHLHTICKDFSFSHVGFLVPSLISLVNKDPSSVTSYCSAAFKYFGKKEDGVNSPIQC